MGESEDEMRASLRAFIKNKLGMPDDDVRGEEIEQIRRVRLRRERQNMNEALVLFSDVETRDRVSSYARNLSQFIDIAGKPTAGIRFDIPDHLLGVHRTLLQYGHTMWIKHRKDPEFRRNVRHNDAELTYCLDIKFPKRHDWITVTYARALQEKKKRAAVQMNDEELLSTTTKTTAEVPVSSDDCEETGRGPCTPNGSITSFSWRAPRKHV